MFGIGFQELLLILVVALIVLGPQRLPEVAKSLGKFYREIRGSIDEVKDSITKDISTIKEIQQKEIYTNQQKNVENNLKPSFEEEFDSEIKLNKESKNIQREKYHLKKKIVRCRFGRKSTSGSTTYRTSCRAKNKTNKNNNSLNSRNYDSLYKSIFAV